MLVEVLDREWERMLCAETGAHKGKHVYVSYRRGGTYIELRFELDLGAAAYRCIGVQMAQGQETRWYEFAHSALAPFVLDAKAVLVAQYPPDDVWIRAGLQ